MNNDTNSNTKTEEEVKYGKPVGYDINGNALYENPKYREKKANPIHDFIFGRRLLNK